MDIQDILKEGDSVGDVHSGLPRKISKGTDSWEVEVSNYSLLNLSNFSEPDLGHYAATMMLDIALEGLVRHPVNKIAYVVCFRDDYAVCAFSYDGTHYGQFELKLKGK